MEHTQHAVARGGPAANVLPGAAALLGLALPFAVARGWLRPDVPRQHSFCLMTTGWHSGVVWPALAALVMLGLLWLRLWRPHLLAPWKLLLAAVLCCYLCAVGTRATLAMGFTALAVTVLHDGSNSYYATAVDHPDAWALARDYPRQMPGLRLHAATQSPGAVLLHAGLRQCLQRSPAALAVAEVLLWLNPCHRAEEVVSITNYRWRAHFAREDVLAALLLALLFPLVLSLGVLPTYALARRLAGWRAALLAAALYAVTPSFLWFTASIDQLYPPLAVTVLLLVYLGVRHATRPAFVLGAGLLCGLGIFLNFGFCVVAAIAAGFVALLAVRRGAGFWRRAPLHLALLTVGLAAVLAFVQFVLGIDLVGVVRVSAQLRSHLYEAGVVRPWLTWVLLNPVEFSIGLGFSSTAVVVAALAGPWRRPRPAALLLAATAGALALLNLTGAARAEWSRMLMFAMPLCLAGAAPVLRRLRLTRPAPAVVLVGAQVCYALACSQLFDVWGRWTETYW